MEVESSVQTSSESNESQPNINHTYMKNVGKIVCASVLSTEGVTTTQNLNTHYICSDTLSVHDQRDFGGWAWTDAERHGRLAVASKKVLVAR